MHLGAEWDLLDGKLGKYSSTGGVSSTSLFHSLPHELPHSPTQLTQPPIRVWECADLGCRLWSTHMLIHVCRVYVEFGNLNATSVFECRPREMLTSGCDRSKTSYISWICRHKRTFDFLLFYKSTLWLLFWTKSLSWLSPYWKDEDKQSSYTYWSVKLWSGLVVCYVIDD